MNILLTVEELAKYLKIKPDTIYKKVRKGELPAIKLGKLVRFSKETIDQWILDQAALASQKMAQAREVATKVMHDVPEMIEDVKKAPLNKKQAALTRGIKGIWDDLSHGIEGIKDGVKKNSRRKSSKTIRKKTKKARPVAASKGRSTVQSKKKFVSDSPQPTVVTE